MTHDERFRFSTPITVRWGDCDAAGHVNNATYLTYLEEARIAYWRAVLADVPFGGLIIARVEIDYRAQAFTGDALQVRAAVTELGTTSFWVDYEIVRADGALVARARSAQLFFDYATQKPTPMPADFRRLVTAYESGVSDG
jgi:acyl-CoA thioester hydrolase